MNDQMVCTYLADASTDAGLERRNELQVPTGTSELATKLCKHSNNIPLEVLELELVDR
jgi:hypothetical protein